MSNSVSFTSLSTSLGVEVDLDPSKPFSRAEQEDIGALLDEHHLLLFRGHEHSLEEQRRTVGYIAEPDLNSVISDPMEETSAGDGELLFHSDQAYASLPTFGISLYGEQLSAGSACTTYANLRRAYLQLPEDLRRRLEGRQGLHLWETNHNHRRLREDDATDEGTGSVHPVFLKNPRTGEPSLYVSMLHTVRILGFDAAESDGLIKEAFSYLYAPDNLYTHHWQLHDLVVWNNLTLHHAREPLPRGVPRVLRRVTFGNSRLRDPRYRGFVRLDTRGRWPLTSALDA
jgi:taurine dioxygenase